ncbi:integral membrane protein [Colletotrichum salicis]|uniref:Integral membrane protein n=1 Tax=Colletotrichum salicis TaxID=1209931 RepID=A0A135V108_9PEZI|nr:integral membrane protein [Colletotrichum salicis]
MSVTALSTLFTAARLYVWGIILKKFHSDDYLIVVSVICSWVSVATAVVAVSYGMGLHFEILVTQQKSGAIFWTIAGFPAGVMSFGLPKVAVVALLTRILNPSPWHRMFLWALSLFCLLNLTANMILLFTHCQPTRSQWDFSFIWSLLGQVDTGLFCYLHGSNDMLTDEAAFGGFVDLYLAVYPALVLARLQMSIKKKAALSVALGIGSISSVVAIYKCTRDPSLASNDFTYDTADLVIWTIVEGSTMIIAACIPILQPLGERIFGKRMFGSGPSGGRHTYENYEMGSGGRAKSETEVQLRTWGFKSRVDRHVDGDSLDELESKVLGARSCSSQEMILDQKDFGHVKGEERPMHFAEHAEGLNGPDDQGQTEGPFAHGDQSQEPAQARKPSLQN